MKILSAMFAIAYILFLWSNIYGYNYVFGMGTIKTIVLSILGTASLITLTYQKNIKSNTNRKITYSVIFLLHFIIIFINEFVRTTQLSLEIIDLRDIGLVDIFKTAGALKNEMFARTKILTLLTLFITNFIYTINKVKFKESKKIYFTRILAGIVGVLLLTGLWEIVQKPQNKSGIYSHYQEYFEITRVQDFDANKNIEEEPENIIIIQLESLNALLVNEINTPNLWKIQEIGYLNNNVQNASVATNRNVATILCKTLPTLEKIYSETYIQGDKCIPAILPHKNKTFLMSSHIELDKFNTLLIGNGFEIPGMEVFDSQDQRLNWGYKDDIAYRKFFEFQKNIANESFITYMQIGAINHHTFDFYKLLPESEYNNFINTEYYKNLPISARDIAISTYLQDKYFGEALNEYMNNWNETTNLIVLGDHSYPLRVHAEIFANFTNIYQEGLVSAVAFIPSKQSKFNITKNYSLQRISNTEVYDLILSLHNEKHKSRFIEDMKDQPVEEKCLVTVQPYMEKNIILIENDIKKVINIRDNTIKTFDLRNDPEELHYEIEKDATMQKQIDLIDKCMQNSIWEF